MSEPHPTLGPPPEFGPPPTPDPPPVSGPSPVYGRDDDGPGVAALLIALLVADGVLVGALSLAFTPYYLGGVPAPLGVVLTVSAVPWLVFRAGEVDRRLAGLPAFAWFFTVFVLGLAGPGGDVLLPGTWPSLLLIVAGVGAGLWALRRTPR